MVPSVDGGGYFMVASDGGVFTFGDAKFEGSCPSIDGCSGAAVAVMPDASGDGYWLVTATGHLYAFGDAAPMGHQDLKTCRLPRRCARLTGRVIGFSSPMASSMPTAMPRTWWSDQFDRYFRSGHGHLHNRRRRELLGCIVRRVGLHLRRCALRRRRIGHAPRLSWLWVALPIRLRARWEVALAL